MAEFTAKTQEGDIMTGVVKIFYIKGTSGVNSDTFTVAGITSVLGAYLVSTTGTAGTCTFATNVITVTNGGALTWTGLCWGS